jgi:hypothetical protein
MRRRGGRRSAAEDAVVVIDGGFRRRPDPPPELTKRQAEIWRETVASEPVEFFNRAAERGLLAQYCRHRESSETLSGVIDTFKPEWLKNGEGVKRYQALLRLRETESRAGVANLRALRLTNQARWRADKRFDSVPAGPKPWEV